MASRAAVQTGTVGAEAARPGQRRWIRAFFTAAGLGVLSVGGRAAGGAEGIAVAAPRLLQAVAGTVQALDQVGGGGMAVDVADDVAYLAEGPRVVAIDVRRPASPLRLGRSAIMDARVTALNCDGRHCYATAAEFLYVFGTRTPGRLELEARLPVKGVHRDVLLSNDMLLLASGTEGVRVFDVSTPADPILSAHISTTGVSSAVCLKGSIAYIAAGTEGLVVVDLARSEAPRRLGSIDTPGVATDVDVWERTALVADGNTGLHFIDVAQPAAMRITASIESIENHLITGVTVDGNFAYVLDGWYSRVFDIASDAPREVSRLTHDVWYGGYFFASWPRALKIVGGWEFRAEYPGGLMVRDVSDPAAPKQVAVSAATGMATRLVMAGERVYVLNDSRVRVVDASDSGALKPLGGLRVDFYGAEDAAAEGSLLVVMANSRLIVVDASDPGAMVVHPPLETPGSGSAVAIDAGFAFVADGLAGLTIVDVSMASSAEVVRSLALGVDATDVEVRGGFAYVVGRSGGLRIVDVGDPRAPKQLSAADTGGAARSVEVDGDRLYVDVAGRGNVVFDVSDRLRAHEVGVIALNGRLSAQGSLAVVAASGVAYVSVVDPAHPVVLARSTLLPSGGLFTGDVVDVALLNEAEALVAAQCAGLWSVRYAETREPDCATALALPSNGEVSGEFLPGVAGHVYRLDVRQPFSVVNVTAIGQGSEIDMLMYRTCTEGDAGRDAGTGAGRHMGTGAGRALGLGTKLRFSTASQSGSYYLTLEPRSESPVPLSYRLVVDVEELELGSIATLIVTSESRLEAYYAETELREWRRALGDLRDDPAVHGQIIWDVATDTDVGVTRAFEELTAAPNDVAAANAAAKELQRWIWQTRERALPQLRYIVLAGDDRIIPHFRALIRPLGEAPPRWQTERDYRKGSGIDARTGVGNALNLEYTLTDDIYATPVTETIAAGMVGASEVYVPDLAIGRLVESPLEMTRAIRGFLDRGSGRAEWRATTAGYGFMQDAAERVDLILAASGVRDARRTQLRGEQWSSLQLSQLLVGTRQDFGFAAVHADHSLYRAPDGSDLLARDVAGASLSHDGSLVVSVACHAGLSVPDDQRHAEGASYDFPQAWMGRGAAYVGASGWVYGLDGELGYQEKLLVDFADILVGGDAAIGDALTGAKQAFAEERREVLGPKDAKSLVGTMLYGLPMQKLRVAQLSAARSAVVPLPPVVPIETGKVEVLGDDVAVERGRRNTFDRRLMVRKESAAGEAFQFGGQPLRAIDGEPLQPQFAQPLYELEVSGRFLRPRGVVLVGGSYREERFAPPVYSAGALGLKQALSAPGWLM